MKSEVGPYRLLTPLGEGGMGVVWRAEHRVTKQQVALKTVRVEDHRFLRSIRREIQSLAGLRHPGIVSILEDGIIDGLPWYAMPLLEGQELSQWCNALDSYGAQSSIKTNEVPPPLDPQAKTFSDSAQITQQFPGTIPTTPAPLLISDVLPPLPEPKLQGILTVIRRVCETLSFLHGEGVVHQDLKPENVLVRQDSTPVLLDFGISLTLMQGKISRESYAHTFTVS